MMDILDNEVNKRLVFGYFPTMELYPELSESSKKRIHGITTTLEDLKRLEEDPLFFQFIFINHRNRLLEIERVADYNINSGNLINVVINTLYELDFLDIETIQDAVEILPFATELDKIIWHIANASYTGAVLSNEKEDYRSAYKWAFLLRVIQDKEYQTHKTINIDKVIRRKKNIIRLLNCRWDKGWNRFLRTLNEEEKTALDNLKKQRSQLSAQIEEREEKAYFIAKKTDKEWALFLRIANDLSKKESDLIEKILEPISGRDKLKAIYKYQAIVTGLDRFHYTLDGDELELAELLYKVIIRFNKAQYYCRAKIQNNNESFVLHPVIFHIVCSLRTFNYIYIVFHQYRLAPKKENAVLFFLEALTCIEHNLRLEAEKHKPFLEELITDFYNIVTSFFSDNKAAIDQLSFQNLQEDYASIDSSLNQGMMSDYYNDEMYSLAEKSLEDIDIETILAERKIIKPARKKQLVDTIEGFQDAIESIDARVNARQIVISLNTIYMFCDALKITLANKHLRSKLKDPDLIDRYRLELREIDSYLVQKVYAIDGKKSLRMLEYREKKGIDSSVLTSIEIQEERFRNQCFSEVLKDSINSLIERIESKNTEQLIEIKTQIREEVSNYPECDEKNQFAPWLDEVSERICNALIDTLRSDEIGFNEHMSAIKTGLGSESRRLPISTINALTTAEMLYGKYTTEGFAEKGFDYSCISALYYQAFEDAYNDLIWGKYAVFLNSLSINNQSYTSILDQFQSRGIKIPEAKGYLDQDPQKRRHYIIYCNQKNPVTSVKQTCMYGNFAMLMQNVVENSKLDKFCEFFAGIAGFNNQAEMFADKKFMEECREFTKKIDVSTDNRNNASHGGTIIDKQQCQEDKHIIIEELNLVRDNSFGLIQQLLFLIK